MTDEQPGAAPAWAEHAKTVLLQLDQLDYFELLGVATDASLDEVRAGYRALQAVYHPDRVFRSSDRDLVNAVDVISKRLTEAYVVLRDPRKRAQYLADISGPDREARLRFGADSEQRAAAEKRQQILPSNPKARTLYLNAKKAAEKGDWATAARDLKLAVMFEPNNESIKELLERATKGD